jgi:RNA 2',3'-cyclic 3'-phosphodiesterase
LSNNGSGLKLFFAIELEYEIKKGLLKIIETLKTQPWGHRVKWVQPENLHITLRFIGAANPTKVPELTDLAQQAIKKIGPFPLQLDSVRLFPSPTAPRVIATNIIPTAQLFDLANVLEEVVANSGFAPETRPYLPHLTLGRITHYHAPNFQEDITINPARMSVEEIILFNSQKGDTNQQQYIPLEYLTLSPEEMKVF